MKDVSVWTNSNSRADLVIEDVRIADGAKTKDVTIVMESTDPGNVDYGVYFDQHSLRNASSGNTTLTINIMDTGAAGQAATAATPLLNNPYDQFKLGINGVLSIIQLDKTAVAAADTYAQLLTVFQNALVGTGITVALGADFTIVDPISNTNVTGKSIVLTGGAGANITAPNGSGWYNTTGASVPPTSNIYTTYGTGSSSVTELVTSTIVLDDVGRGSTGGDLVVGGLSVGATSTSRGVERFEIEVRDNSKLQTINSTNDSLREVVIKNGVTTNTDATQGAYDKTATNAGNLTVNGNANVTNAVTGQETRGANTDAPLSGIDALHHGNYGFTDVRLIDASAMTGKLALTAQVTTASLAKYVNLADTQSNPTADVAGAGNVNYNVKGANFAYTGGANADTFNVVIDSAVAASTTLTGQSDFTLVIDGGAGNDTITTNIGGNETAAWWVDQKANANITINGGDGDDTITTTGAGAVIINAGSGVDTVFADNSGTIGPKWVINAVGATPDLADLQTNGSGIVTAPATTAFLYKGQVTVTFSGAGGAGLGGGVTNGAAVALANGFEAKADIPTGANNAVTEFYLNQAIKKAINEDAVLAKVLKAEDGPNNTLTVKSLIDGTFNANDLKITVGSTYVASATEDAAIQTAYKAFTGDSTASLLAATGANTATVNAGNAVLGMNGVGVLGGTNVTESAVFTPTALLAGDTVVINGLTITVGVGGATATQIEQALETGTTVGTAVVSGAYTAAWTVSADTAGTVKYTSTTVGTNVADLANTGSVVNAPVVTQGGTTASNGTVSTAADSDNTINLGAGNDVVVLGTSATSNDTLVVTGYDQGKDTIINFTVGGGAADKISFASYMVDKNVTGAVTAKIAATISADNDAAVVANDITIIKSALFTATDTFAGLTAAKLLSAINTTGNVAYAGITDATLNAANGQTATQLVGGVGHAVVLIENDGNKGEYAAFELTFNGAQVAPATEFSAATLIGYFDFGNSIANTALVG